jgi:hypothetical protein
VQGPWAARVGRLIKNFPSAGVQRSNPVPVNYQWTDL